MLKQSKAILDVPADRLSEVTRIAMDLQETDQERLSRIAAAAEMGVPEEYMERAAAIWRERSSQSRLRRFRWTAAVAAASFVLFFVAVFGIRHVRTQSSIGQAGNSISMPQTPAATTTTIPTTSTETTSLIQACYAGDLATVEQLIDQGGDVNEWDFRGATPLQGAAFADSLQVTQKLLDHGANPSIGDANGRTPLYTAANRGYPDVAEALLQHGANPNQKTSDGFPPLYTAAFEGHIDVARVLLRHGADPNMHTNNGGTPLEAAEGEGHPDVARLLIQAGSRKQ